MKTVITIKTDTSLKTEARKAAEEFGIPLGTIINSFLKQFIRTKEISLDLSYKPNKHLSKILEAAELELSNNKNIETTTAPSFISHLKKL